MSIALVIVTDGRDTYLDECVKSLGMLKEGYRLSITERWMHDDTGNDAYRSELSARYPEFTHINGGKRQGCAGAFQSVWRQLRERTRAEYVFLVEQDFVFLRPVNLKHMAFQLNRNPHLAQIALRRQAWNGEEKFAGGVVELHPDWYEDKRYDDPYNDPDNLMQWLEQGVFFTTNPSLFRSTLLSVPWPAHQQGTYSESLFHQQLMRQGTPEVPGDRVRYAYWGARDSGIWVEHIGHQRIGTGY